MIRVCDAIMGNGKSQSAITYINDHPELKFIYITPYLEEAARIKNGCPNADFKEPQQLQRFNYSKLEHTHHLILKGENVATTHAAFKNYTEEVLDAIKGYGYTLIIDENVDVLETCDIHEDDIQLAVDAGYVEYKDNQYSLIKNDYRGNAMKELFWLLRSRQITRIDDEENGSVRTLFYWVLPPDLITSFRDVFILTYLFEGQSLYNFLKIYNLEYINIGIEEIDYGTGFRFCDTVTYVPEYVSHIKDMVKIVDNEKLNSVGDSPTALSMNWFKKNKAVAVPQLKRNIENLFKNIWKDSLVKQRMWATFKGQREVLKGKGYTNGFAMFNLRASNNFRAREYLVYACNIYMNVDEKKFYAVHGIEVDEDRYALSVMVQWIWRSAIRDGKKIYLYLPSSRMRRILNDWMDSLAEGGSGDG